MSTLEGRMLKLRPLTADDVPALRRIVETPEVARWWGPQREDFPLGDEPSSTRFAIVVDGEVAGLIQYWEEKEPDFRHAGIDLFLDPAHQGAGLGTDAVATLSRHLLDDCGHHRITIDPAVENKDAVRCYEKAGFRT